MTRLLIALFLFLGVLVWSAPAAELAPGPGHTLHGKIVHVDATHHAFLLHTVSGKNVVVKVTPKTKIRVDGQPATFADLAAGQKARVRGHKAPNHELFIAKRVGAKN